MKYACPSNIISNAKDFYEIVSFYVDKIQKHINISLAFYQHVADGTVSISYTTHTIVDMIEYIIDPAWNSSSTPPKPEGFDITDPSTWGSLSWDDLPRVINPEKLYASLFIARMDEDQSAEEVIFDYLTENNKIPSGIEWQKIV